MLKPEKMLLYPTADDFLGLLVTLGVTPNEFARTWGVSGARIARMAHGQHHVEPWAIRAALYQLGGNLTMPEDVSAAREAGRRAARDYKANADEVAPRDLSAAANSRRMERARAERSDNLTPEQRSARRAGYKID